MYSENPDEHAAHCPICDYPVMFSDTLCQACYESLDQEADDEDWGGMTDEERVEFFVMNWENGNLTDAVNFLMHDGDVRIDSVLLLAQVVEYYDNLPDTHLHTDTINKFINAFVRTVEKWERT